MDSEKEDDKRLLGNPGEIKTTYMENGSKFITKIGGRWESGL